MNTKELNIKFKALLYKKSFWIGLGFFILILGIFLINSFHEVYPDEFDNVLGGWYIIHGKLIYKDWFTHHGPVPYFISAFINIFAFHSFVKFRVLYSLLLLIFTFGSFEMLRRRLRGINVNFYLYFILLLGISATYFWGHMLIADNVSAFLLVPVFALVFLKTLHNRIFDSPDYTIISIFSALALLSALTYSFLIAGLFAYLIIYYFVRLGRSANILDLVKIITILLAPYFVFAIYLLITGSFADFYRDAIKFNRAYYIYYPGLPGKPPSNPLRYAIIIAQGFHNNFSSLLVQVPSFNFSFPFNIALAVANTALGIYLLLKKKYLPFLFVLGMLIFANARTNPLTSRETDYQSAVYILFSLFNMAFALPAIYKEINITTDQAKKIILGTVFVILTLYSFFFFTFVLRKFSYKAYDKYMGFAGLIYDSPKISNFINAVETKNDYAWIGPFYFDELYYLQPKLPSRYQIMIPAMKPSGIEHDMVNQFKNKEPDLIYFNKDEGILGQSPTEYGSEFIDFLNKDYVKLDDYTREGVSYQTSFDPSLILGQRLYVNKSKAGEIFNRMIEKNLVQPQ